MWICAGALTEDWSWSQKCGGQEGAQVSGERVTQLVRPLEERGTCAWVQGAGKAKEETVFPGGDGVRECPIFQMQIQTCSLQETGSCLSLETV